jgi:enoyl-[acyl-carrier protein] reductase I
MRMGEINALAEKTNSKIIPADATSVEELTNLFTQSQEILGGKIDFVLHSIGMSVNIRKKIAYPELNYDYYALSEAALAPTRASVFELSCASAVMRV